jgi:hypothetical protein
MNLMETKPFIAAKKAVAANPERSNRWIAEEIGTCHWTVRRAREAIGRYAPDDRRVGKDGYWRSLPTKNAR